MRHDKVLVQIDAVAKGLLRIGVPLPSLSDKSSVKVQNRIDRPFVKGSLAGSASSNAPMSANRRTSATAPSEWP